MQKSLKVFSLTVEDRILLHLMNYYKMSEDWDAPLAAAQIGIANATGIGRNNVPRAVRNLMEKDLVIEKRSHIKGIKIKRKVYFLTSKGLAEAQKIREAVEDTEIYLQDIDGEKKRMLIRDIPKYTSEKIPLSEIVQNAKGGVFDYGFYHQKKVSREEKFIDFTVKLPRLKYFFGREKELQEVSSWLGSKKKVLVIQGMAGIGKTTLVSKLTEEYRNKMHIFYYKHREWTTLRNLNEGLSDFMAKMGKKELRHYLKSNENIDITNISEIIVREARGTGTLLIFDDYHKAQKSIIRFFHSLTESLERTEGLKLIMLGRLIVPFYDRREVIIKKTISELHLKGLDEKSSEELLRYREIEVQEFKSIYALTEGHPLFLELVEASVTSPNRNIWHYINEEILSKMTDKEKRLMMVASVFRYPVQTKAFFLEEDIDFDIMESLLKRSLLQKSIEGFYDIHDLLREFFYERLTPKQKRDYHLAAAEYCLGEMGRVLEDLDLVGVHPEEKDGGEAAVSRSERADIYHPEKTILPRLGDLASLEAQYHFLAAEEHKRAAELASLNGRDIINQGYIEEFMEILKEIDLEKVNKEHGVDITLLKGDILNIRGEWDDALEHYQQLIDTIPDKTSKKYKFKKAEAYRKIGNIYQRRNEYDEAIENLQKSLDLSQKIKDIGGIVEVYYIIGTIYEKNADNDRAREYFEKSLKNAKKIGDLGGVAKAYYAFGRIEYQKRNFAKAVDHMKDAVETLEKIGDLYQLVKVYAGLGSAYMMKRELDKAVEFEDKCIETSEKIGDLRMMGYGYANAASAYIEKSVSERSLKYFRIISLYLDRALDIFEKIDEKRLIASVYMHYGTIHLLKKDKGLSKRYFSDSLKILKRLDVPYILGRAHENIGGRYIELGDRKNGIEQMEKAIRIFEEIGAKDDVKRLERDIEKIRK